MMIIIMIIALTQQLYKLSPGSDLAAASVSSISSVSISISIDY